MNQKERNIKNRTEIQKKIKAELIGPDPFPFKSQEKMIVVDINNIKTLKEEDLYKPKQQINGEEILHQDSPAKRYGAAIILPKKVNDSHLIEEYGAEDYRSERESEVKIPKDVNDKKLKKELSRSDIEESDDYDISLANSFKPSTFGISFLTDFKNANELTIELEFATYKKIILESDTGKKLTTWFRKPGKDKNQKNFIIKFNKKELIEAKTPLRKSVPNFEDKLELVAVKRNFQKQFLITVSMVNLTEYQQENGKALSADEDRKRFSIDENCFFQCQIKKASVINSIIPYPEISRFKEDDKDENINKLLYRDKQTFAVGHGCAASWKFKAVGRVDYVSSDFLPEYNQPMTSPEIRWKDEEIRISMRKLAGLDDTDDGRDELELLIKCYGDWIKKLKDYKNRPVRIAEELYDTAEDLIEKCELCLARIEEGLNFLYDDSNKSVLSAFQYSNHAMLLGQLRAQRNVREPGESGKYGDIDTHDPKVEHPKKGYWRPFQIAFFLMTLKSMAELGNNDEREIVDLIWFPTGGGKTEAYLGLAAFTIFFNRLSGQSFESTDVIMRYTLRLLTTQQFERASLLICAMEYLRCGADGELGDQRFSIGMLVGGSSSPNTRVDAKAKFKKFKDNIKHDEDRNPNPFNLFKCPWCSAKMGRVYVGKSERGYKKYEVKGYYKGSFDDGDHDQTICYECPDRKCDFGGSRARGRLPIINIDEDLYASPPNLIIGTVDKMALLTWNPQMRSLFGIDLNGDRVDLPPSLIIQDELHLISGPLGSMVGAYETVIEELCTRNDDDGNRILPKIIASTATISRAQEQVKALYARKDVRLFPPSGLEAKDSFFASQVDGIGKHYLGIFAPSHGSLQVTQRNIYGAILHAANMIKKDDEKDPWWTLLCFFNSIRELGGGNSLMNSDVREHLELIHRRYGDRSGKIPRRWINKIRELTGRLKDSEIPKSIQELEEKYTPKGNKAIDVCLASNIIEVGIDIDRLSLLAIVGQPKTTSQYIQVSGRVGRRPETPGLVVTFFSPSKPRDRSHYEKFHSYHQKLHAQVEPTSVTPFSPPAIDRAVHALIVAYIRLKLPLKEANHKTGTARSAYALAQHKLKKEITEILERRVQIVDKNEEQYLKDKINECFDQWRSWDPKPYGHFYYTGEDNPLIYQAGSYARTIWNNKGWPTMSSLRNVDRVCEAEVTDEYNRVNDETT